MYRNRESVFRLTEAEDRALKLRAAGATWNQLRSLGLLSHVINGRAKNACARADKEAAYKPTAGTTLAKARRQLRPITDVRKGKWKSGE